MHDKDASSHGGTDVPRRTYTKVRLTDYPTFSGKIYDWYPFKYDFTATADTDDKGETLIRHNDNDPVLRDLGFIAKCRDMFSILTKVTAHGTAAPKVRKHAETKNGNLAWLDLEDFYESQGNQMQCVKEILADIRSLRLDYNSMGGFKTYQSTFESLILRLEETSDPQNYLSDLMKKETFCDGIIDQDYARVISITSCMDDWDYPVAGGRIPSRDPENF